jgi:UDP-4-amino-4-deoxy-L-arabinose-oxoglutarate aminotransferase
VDRFNARRAELARRYLELLSEVDEVHPLEPAPWPHTHAWHLFVVRLDLDHVSIQRDDFISALAQEGIGTGLHFTPVHLHRFYREKYGFREGDLPATEAAGERILSLPLYPLMADEDVERVIEAVRRVVSRHRRNVD